MGGTSKADQLRYRQLYPDVTKAYQQEIEDIGKEINTIYKIQGRVAVYLSFNQNFPNNGKWDLQVNHDLPGQRVTFYSDGNLQRDNAGHVITEDEHAIFNEQIVRAGYLSNYVYGYAAAAGGLRLDVVQTIPQLKSEHPDNPQDLKAQKEGYEAYLKRNPQAPEAVFINSHDVMRYLNSFK